MIEKFFTAKSKDVYLLTTVANFMYKIQVWFLISMVVLMLGLTPLSQVRGKGWESTNTLNCTTVATFMYKIQD